MFLGTESPCLAAAPSVPCSILSPPLLLSRLQGCFLGSPPSSTPCSQALVTASALGATYTKRKVYNAIRLLLLFMLGGKWIAGGGPIRRLSQDPGRESDGLDHGDGGGENWLDSGCVLRAGRRDLMV